MEGSDDSVPHICQGDGCQKDRRSRIWENDWVGVESLANQVCTAKTLQVSYIIRRKQYNNGKRAQKCNKLFQWIFLHDSSIVTNMLTHISVAVK